MKTKLTSKINAVKKITVLKSATKVATTAVSFKHEFKVLSADEINNSRSKAYQYLAL